MSEVKRMDDEVQRMLEKAESLGWKVENERENKFDFSKTSPAGQDFHMSIDAEDNDHSFVYNLRERCEYLSAEAVKTCEENIKFISENAILMTKEEVEEFINYDYIREIPWF